MEGIWKKEENRGKEKKRLEGGGPEGNWKEENRGKEKSREMKDGGKIEEGKRGRDIKEEKCKGVREGQERRRKKMKKNGKKENKEVK